MFIVTFFYTKGKGVSSTARVQEGGGVSWDGYRDQIFTISVEMGLHSVMWCVSAFQDTSTARLRTYVVH